MLKKLSNYALALLLILVSSSSSASAIQSPANCNSNRLTLSITRDKISVKQGDVLTYTITLSNIDAGASIACDIDSATVTVTLPALDGTPTGQVVTLTTNGNYPAGTPFGVIGTVPYTVNVNNGVTDATAEAEVIGVLHDAPADHTAQISKTIGTTVIYEPNTPEEPPVPEIPRIPSLPGMPNTGITP